MQLYLVRHGHALDRESPEAVNDEMRWLTDEGREETSATAHVLKKLGVKPHAVLSSPLVRARQTAEVICEVVGPSSGPVICEHLAPHGSLSSIVDTVREHGPAKQLVLVGHMPDISTVIGYLISGHQHEPVHMRTAGGCRVDLPDDHIQPGHGDIRWLLPPKIAARLLS
jgi:phosphohistidine phosphatase